MSEDDKDAGRFRRDDVRQCAMCQRTVPLAEGAYVGGGRWCCFSCAAALYSDEDDDAEEE